jgi:hypothetical protein
MNNIARAGDALSANKKGAGIKKNQSKWLGRLKLAIQIGRARYGLLTLKGDDA